MTNWLVPIEQELKTMARESRAIAAQAEALAEVNKTLPNHLDSNPALALIAADTVVLENYNKPKEAMAWLTGALRLWLRANAQINQKTKRSVFYRYVFLPYPSAVKNWQQRSNLIKIILYHLHFQMWHGVVCGVIFVDPQTCPTRELAQQFNFLAIPTHTLIFDLPGFYQSDSIKGITSEGHSARLRSDQIQSYLASTSVRPIWLYYDEENFHGPRLHGKRWQDLRRFFSCLHGPQPRCANCNNPVDPACLDHIAPVSRGYMQTLINFQVLCRRCNTEKRNLEGDNPYIVSLLGLNEFRTGGLEYVFSHSPPWLGFVSPPTLRNELLWKV